MCRLRRGCYFGIGILVLIHLFVWFVFPFLEQFQAGFSFNGHEFYFGGLFAFEDAVDVAIVKADACNFFSGGAVVDAFYPGPADSCQTHGAWL